MPMQRAVAAMGLLLLTSPAFATDLAESAMAGDPTWPPVETVAPAVTLSQRPIVPAAVGELGPPGDPDPAPAVALHQAPLTDDPLQGVLPLPGRAEEGAPRVACHRSCTCSG